MITEDSLREKYSTAETNDLLEVYANKSDYTKSAVEVVVAELKKRKVPENDIIKYKSILKPKLTEQEVGNYFVDLNVFQKLLSYVIIIPRYRYYFTRKFAQHNNVLKSQQANYYLVMGVSFLILAAISANFTGSLFLYVWGSGFVISFLFDIGFNKQRQITDLQIKVTQGKNPWEFGN